MEHYYGHFNLIIILPTALSFINEFMCTNKQEVIIMVNAQIYSHMYSMHKQFH